MTLDDHLGSGNCTTDIFTLKENKICYKQRKYYLIFKILIRLNYKQLPLFLPQSHL